MDQWYKNIYRRHLVDMHINDTKNVYLSKFSAEEYFKYLKKAKIQSPMIYIQSHTGLCYFPTQVSKTHQYFIKNPDEINKLINLCHKDGMKVVGYYSLIFNNQAIYDHPEWEMVNADGTTWRDHGQRYGLACPNNEEYRKFLVPQIQEIKAKYGDIDAIFFDMPYWEVVCHCPSCQQKWKKLSSFALPETIDFNDEESRKYIKARQDWMGEFVKYVKELTDEIFDKKITVEFNFAAVVGCDWLGGSSEVINEYCEFTGGDLYGDLYNHSFTAKYYYAITNHQPFEYMTCRCNHNLREHTINKNDITLEAEIMLSCMHHGASLIIDAINPDGSLDLRVANKIGKAFAHQLPYEKYMDKGVLKGKVAVYFDSKTQYSSTTLPYNKQAVLQTVRTLIENHVEFHIIANTRMDHLNQYDLIIAPCLNTFDNPEVLKLIDYVKQGGHLYLSGHSDPRLLKEFFDGENKGLTFGESKYHHVYKGYDEVQCYVYPTDKEYKKYFNEFNKKYPLPVIHKLPKFIYRKGEVKAMICLPYTDPDNNTVFASIHSNPPGVYTKLPAIIENHYGQGKVIYSIAPIEADGRYNYKDILMNMITPLFHQEVQLKASKYVELIHFEGEKEDIINLFDLNFANDIVKRDFTLSLPKNATAVKEAISEKPYVIKNGKIKGNFTKYISLIISKK